MFRHLLMYRRTNRTAFTTAATRTTAVTTRTAFTAVTSAAIAVALGAGPATALPAAGPAGPAQGTAGAEVLVPAPAVHADGPQTLLTSGSDGMLHREGGGYLWTTTYNRTTRPVPELDGVPEESIVRQHDTVNRVTYTRPREDGGTDIVRIGMEDPRFGSTLTVPAGYLNPTVAGGWVLATVDQGDGTYRLVEYRNGRESPIRLPDGATTGAEPVTYGSAYGRLLIGWTGADGTPGYGVVGAPDNTVTPLPVRGEASSLRVTQEEVSWVTRDGGTTAVHIRGVDSNAAPRVVPLDVRSPGSAVQAYPVGDNVLWYEGEGGTLRLTPYAGAETSRDLLTGVESGYQLIEGRGEFAALGKDADGRRGIHLFGVDGLGLVSDLAVRQAPRTQVGRGTVRALSLAGGRLRHTTDLSGTTTLHGLDVGVGPQPRHGAALPDFEGLAPGRFADGGDEGTARLLTDPETGHDILVTGDDPRQPADTFALPHADGRIAGVSPEFLLYRAGGRVLVVDTARDRIVRDLPEQAAALDHGTLLVASRWLPGTVHGIDLRSGRITGALRTGASCVPDELQSSGTLLYWSCAGQDTAGVRDRATGRTWPAPATGTLLGDRFLAARNGGTLHLTGLEAGGGTTDLGVVDHLKPTASGEDRGRTWTVDPGAGKLAWVDADDTVHVTAPQQAVSPLTMADSVTPATAGPAGWEGVWWLSKPAASWTLVLTDRRTGAEIRTWTGADTRGTVRVSWDGTSATGAPVPRGGYAWKLTAAPADGTGGPGTATGQVRVTG
ncbi:FlgD immunoglobulin-like domain containing protein [Streptomyces zhihengii]|uniref:FlgD immunoglobulin-like domain containing protein n=1 Tax=Streptomyces zhihengii TaxID=1818004 RepID=UPI0034532030